MEPFATLLDLKDRWPDLPVAQEALATTKLLDTSMMIRSLRRDIDDAIADDAVLAHAALVTVCGVVKRAMQRPVGLEGMRQVQETTGPFSQGFTLDNPSGDLYLTKAEKRALGIGVQRAFTVDLLSESESSSS